MTKVKQRTSERTFQLVLRNSSSCKVSPVRFLQSVKIDILRQNIYYYYFLLIISEYFEQFYVMMLVLYYVFVSIINNSNYVIQRYNHSGGQL